LGGAVAGFVAAFIVLGAFAAFAVAVDPCTCGSAAVSSFFDSPESGTAGACSVATAAGADGIALSVAVAVGGCFCSGFEGFDAGFGTALIALEPSDAVVATLLADAAVADEVVLDGLVDVFAAFVGVGAVFVADDFVATLSAAAFVCVGAVFVADGFVATLSAAAFVCTLFAGAALPCAALFWAALFWAALLGAATLPWAVLVCALLLWAVLVWAAFGGFGLL
jgi:hypothetical protein